MGTNRAAERDRDRHATASPEVVDRAAGRIGHPLLDLQASAGNRAVSALVAGAQAKLVVGAAGDPYEQEADRVARAVADGFAGGTVDEHRAAPVIARRGGGASAGSDGGPVDPEVEAQVRAAQGKGDPLPSAVQTKMEAALEQDFSDVRVHTDPLAAQLNAAIGARAFTVAKDIFFASPADLRDTELVAHELTHVVQQRSGRVAAVQAKAAKPSARIGSSKAKLTSKLEEQVNEKAHQSEREATSSALHTLDAGYYLDLLLYKIEKHAGDRAKTLLYTIPMPAAARWPVYDRAWRTRNGVAVAVLAKTGWDADQAKVEQLALGDPDFFVEHFLLDGMRRADAEKGVLQAIIEEKDFLGNLRTKSPKAYDRLVAEVPVLRVVAAVEAKVESGEGEEAESGEGEDGTVVTLDRVVRMLFEAFVKNEGIDVAYSGTKIDDNLVMLTGQTKADKTYRDTELKPIMPDIPAKLSTACHQLLGLFQSVLKSYPGLEALKIDPGDEPTAVLTEKLTTLPGGLIPSSYQGNVFDANGKPTGQVFFSGDRAKISKSHSWVVVDGVAYDPVLGTRGAGVAGAINGKFEFLDDTTVATEVGGNRVLTLDRTLKTSGDHGITAGWRLTTAS